MNIGILLPSIYASKRYGEGRIFAPLPLAVALADELVTRGHEVLFYSAAEVQTKATLIAGNSDLVATDPYYFQFRYREGDEQKYTAFEILKRDFEYDLTERAYQDAREGKIDIIHSYHDFGAHYFNELTGFPTVYTLHDLLPQLRDTLEYFRYDRFKHHEYISISNAQRTSVVPMHFAATIYHGVRLEEYDFHGSSDNHFIHFGRVMEDKGTDIAIAAAKAVGMPLHIATSNIRGNRSALFYDTKIAPAIDGTSVTLAGYLSGKEKSDFIGNGKAFLLPLHWEEPFGLVMIEAMACGTPVIAYNRGSVAEIVKDGVTGFIIEPEEEDIKLDRKRFNLLASGKKVKPFLGGHSWIIKKRGIEGMIEAMKRIGEIDRTACRRHVEEHFIVEKMVEGYERVYQKILASKG